MTTYGDNFDGVDPAEEYEIDEAEREVARLEKGMLRRQQKLAQQYSAKKMQQKSKKYAKKFGFNNDAEMQRIYGPNPEAYDQAMNEASRAFFKTLNAYRKRRTSTAPRQGQPVSRYHQADNEEAQKVIEKARKNPTKGMHDSEKDQLIEAMLGDFIA